MAPPSAGEIVIIFILQRPFSWKRESWEGMSADTQYRSSLTLPSSFTRMDRWDHLSYATESIWFRLESAMSQKQSIATVEGRFLTLIYVRDAQEEHTTENQPTSLESTPKKLLFWENNRSSSSAGNKSDELMTIRLREMEAVTELRELRLRLMELETQVNWKSNKQKNPIVIVVWRETLR